MIPFSNGRFGSNAQTWTCHRGKGVVEVVCPLAASGLASLGAKRGAICPPGSLVRLFVVFLSFQAHIPLVAIWPCVQYSDSVAQREDCAVRDVIAWEVIR